MSDHQQPISKACFAFKINEPISVTDDMCLSLSSQNPVDCSVESLLLCRFPALRFSVGKFYLRVTLGQMLVAQGKTYEELDGICAFKVLPADTHPWRLAS